MANGFTAYDPAALPAAVLGFLDAQDERRHHDAREFFVPDATVIDDGRTYRGVAEIGAWIERSASEYEYTTTRLGQAWQDAAHVTVQTRVTGNFPGGTVTLRHQFELEEDRIARLVIEV